MKNIITLSIIFFYIAACTNSKPAFLSQNAERAISSHKIVAILPFKVNFSENYKATVKIELRNNSEDYWREQQRLAGLDLQKDLFLMTNKLVEKNRFTVVVQDILSTRKFLQNAGIKFSQIESSDKTELARELGVDAVIWGTSDVNLNLSSFSPNNNSVETQLFLYDSRSGELIWKDHSFQRPSNFSDTPQSLGKQTLNQLVRNLPYRHK
jgi:hypothetical protein